MKKILVVDDDLNLRNVLSRYLERRGYVVQAAEDGIEALETFEKDPPDLVISDVLMPRMDGYAFCRRLRAMQHGQLVPFIFVSSKSDIEDRVHGHSTGADDYLCKPFEPKELLAKIESQLEKQRNISSELVRAFSASSDKVVIALQSETELLHCHIRELQEENERLRNQLRSTHKINFKNQNDNTDCKAEDELEDILKSHDHSAIGVFSHALKGELMNINNSEKALRELLVSSSEDVYEELDIIQRSADNSILHVRRLVESFNVGGVQIREISISEVLERFRKLTRIPSRVHLKIDLAKDIEQWQIVADLEQLVLVLNELVTNSIKALRHKGGEIKLIIKKRRSQLIILVKDDGSGIPHEILSGLFQEQVPSKSSSGLGLKLCQRMIAQLRGELRLVSSSPRGTTMSVALPIVE